MNKSKAALFLMELLIVLLFFSIAGAICLQLFSDAHITNNNSSDLSNANIILTNVAEQFYSSDLSSSSNTNESISTYYDDYLNPSANSAFSAYTLVETTSLEDRFVTKHISIFRTKDNSLLLEQDIVRYERMVTP